MEVAFKCAEILLEGGEAHAFFMAFDGVDMAFHDMRASLIE